MQDQETNSQVVSPLLTNDFSSNNFLFQGRYLITLHENSLLVVDSNRAYERIIYDELMQKFISNPIASQQLLFPMERMMSSTDKNAWNESASLLKHFGFTWEYTDELIQLNAVPAILQQESIDECMDQILERIAYQSIDKGEIAHAVVSSIALAAGRQQKITNNEAARNLMEHFFNSENQLSPEGKKVVSYIFNEDIKALF
jgi:DNA mismatch repair protein MutL